MIEQTLEQGILNKNVGLETSLILRNPKQDDISCIEEFNRYMEQSEKSLFQESGNYIREREKSPENKVMRKMAKDIGKLIGTVVTTPFYIPTFARVNNGGDFWVYGFGCFCLELAMGTVGLLGVTMAVEDGTISPSSFHTYLGICGTLAATNGLSGLYEWFRYEKDKIDNPRDYNKSQD